MEWGKSEDEGAWTIEILEASQTHAPLGRSEGVYRENGGVTWDVSTVDRPFRSGLGPRRCRFQQRGGPDGQCPDVFFQWCLDVADKRFDSRNRTKLRSSRF